LYSSHTIFLINYLKKYVKISYKYEVDIFHSTKYWSVSDKDEDKDQVKDEVCSEMKRENTNWPKNTIKENLGPHT